MIRMITGKLGAGKTYWCIHYLAKKYYEFDDLILEWTPKTSVRIVSNIRGLRLPHENLTQLIYDDWKAKEPKDLNQTKLREVFSAEFVEGSKNVIFIIDEAQKIFDRKFYDKGVFSFFQMSRQEGVDILLITQDVGTLAKELQVLCETEVRAMQRSLRTKNLFIYKHIIGDETVRTSSVKFRKDIAALYTSMVRQEKEKVSFIHYRYAVVIGVSVIAVLILLKMTLGMFFGNWSQNGKAIRPERRSEPLARTEAKAATGSYSGKVGLLSPEEVKSEISKGPEVKAEVPPAPAPAPAPVVVGAPKQETANKVLPVTRMATIDEIKSGEPVDEWKEPARVISKGNVDVFIDSITGRVIGHVRYTDRNL